MSWLIGLALAAVVAVLVVGYLNLPTSSFRPAFEATPTKDEGGWEGFTLVQRIEAVRLKGDGREVRITLRASSMPGSIVYGFRSPIRQVIPTTPLTT